MIFHGTEWKLARPELRPRTIYQEQGQVGRSLLFVRCVPRF